MLIATSQIAGLKNNYDRSHFQKVFSLALGINDPWYIKSQDMVPCAKNPDILEKRVEVDFKDGSRFSYNG